MSSLTCEGLKGFFVELCVSVHTNKPLSTTHNSLHKNKQALEVVQPGSNGLAVGKPDLHQLTNFQVLRHITYWNRTVCIADWNHSQYCPTCKTVKIVSLLNLKQRTRKSTDHCWTRFHVACHNPLWVPVLRESPPVPIVYFAEFCCTSSTCSQHGDISRHTAVKVESIELDSRSEISLVLVSGKRAKHWLFP